jgi:hypothetical protein
MELDAKRAERCMWSCKVEWTFDFEHRDNSIALGM